MDVGHIRRRIRSNRDWLLSGSVRHADTLEFEGQEVVERVICSRFKTLTKPSRMLEARILEIWKDIS